MGSWYDNPKCIFSINKEGNTMVYRPWILLLVIGMYTQAYERQCGDILPRVTPVSPFRNGQKPTYSYVMAEGKIPGSRYQCYVLLDEQDIQDLYALLSDFKPDARIELVVRLLKQRNQKPMTRNTLEILEDLNKYKGFDTVDEVLNEILPVGFARH